MQICVDYLVSERPTMMQNNVRLVHVGRREGLSQRVLDTFDETIHITSGNTGLGAVSGPELRQPDGDHRWRPPDCRTGPPRRARARGHRRNHDQQLAIHSRDSRPGLADPHSRADANQQFPALADQKLLRTVRDGCVLAGLYRACCLLAAIQDYVRRERRYGGLGSQEKPT